MIEMRLFGVLALIAPLLAAPAQAQEKPKAAENVDFAPVPLPIVVDGRLVNYVFVALRLTPQRDVDASRIKEREPYVKDLLVRVGHAAPFNRAGDPTHVDNRRLLALVARESGRLIGPGLVRNIGIASETPQRRTGLPQPKAVHTIVP